MFNVLVKGNCNNYYKVAKFAMMNDMFMDPHCIKMGPCKLLQLTNKTIYHMHRPLFPCCQELGLVGDKSLHHLLFPFEFDLKPYLCYKFHLNSLIFHSHPFNTILVVSFFNL